MLETEVGNSALAIPRTCIAELEARPPASQNHESPPMTKYKPNFKQYSTRSAYMAMIVVVLVLAVRVAGGLAVLILR